MYVNLVFAIAAVAGALALIRNQAPVHKPKLDLAGTLTVTGGLFALVYGFSHAQTTSWANHTTVGMIATGVGLLMLFVWLEARSNNPLLPLRVVTDRNRGASFLSVGISGAAIFAIFLFLTYYMQQNLGYSPIVTGLSFLPMTATIMVTAVISTTKLRGRFGPRPLVFTGMGLASVGMLSLTGLGLTASYASDILPSLVVMGAGIGLVMSNAMNNATLGVEPADAGVASATVSASQQVGGSIGTALLSTLAASAATSFVSSHAVAVPSARAIRLVAAQAAVHGYTTAFAFAAGIFAVGAIVALVLFEHGVRQLDPSAEPAFAH
jgi:hypothetical protein